MADGYARLAEESRAEAYATPLDKFDVANMDRFQNDTHWPWFERLRKEDPVHYTAEGDFGAYWSVTKYDDIVAVDGNHEVFSSDSETGDRSRTASPSSTASSRANGPASSRWTRPTTTPSARR